LGEPAPDDSIGSSEYLELVHGIISGTQQIDVKLEKNVQACVIKACERGIINSAHDCSDGGLAVAVAESCIQGNIGFKGKVNIPGRRDSALFGEAQSRVVVSVKPTGVSRLESLAFKHNVPITRLGVTGGDRLDLNGIIDLAVKELHQSWANVL
jgi:phosphoribosylformylglycinamidine synthase subunit PurL